VSAIDPEVPPAGEEIHLPGPTVAPVLLAVGVTVALIGVTFHILLVIAGTLLTLGVTARWIADVRRDVDALPLEHRH
jgi:hypothetical protein